MQKLHTNSQNSSFQIWQIVHIGQIKVYKHQKGCKNSPNNHPTDLRTGQSISKKYRNLLTTPPRNYLFVFRVFLSVFSYLMEAKKKAKK